MVKDLLYWLFDPLAEFLIRAKYMMETSYQHLAKSMLTMFDCLLDEWGEEAPAITPAQSTNWLIGNVLFAVVWTFGATLNEEYRVKFDVFFRELLNDQNTEFPRPKDIKLAKTNMFPDPETIYDYCFLKKANGQWENWTRIGSQKTLLPDLRYKRPYIIL